MTKLVIHQPKNFESRYYRFYNILFDKLIERIKTEFDVIDARYYKYANSKYYPVLLLCNEKTFSDCDLHMLECEMIIENYDTKEIKVLSVSDDLTAAILSYQNNNLLTKVLVSQFNREKIFSHIYNELDKEKYSPWVYFPQNDYDYEMYYEIRKQKTDLTDKFYFRGTSLESRKITSFFNKEYFEGGAPIGGFHDYALDLLNYKVGYSIAGRGEFCYRDIEYMAMGIPFLRFKYMSEMSPKLIPNYHYISVDRPEDLKHESNCTEEHAKLIEKRFLEVKDDKNFLDFISNNAREYYTNFIKFDNCVDHTFKLLDLDKWKVQQ